MERFTSSKKAKIVTISDGVEEDGYDLCNVLDKYIGHRLLDIRRFS